MPQSRKRKGHSYQKPSDIPQKQRTKGRILWAILIGVFGFLMAFFATEGGYVIPVIGALIGAVAGYFIGKNMEKEISE